MLHVVTADEAGARTDAVVARADGRSRGWSRKRSRAATCASTATPGKGSRPLAEGDVLEFEVAPQAPPVALPEAIDVPIVYEDSDVIVIDKPAGMITHPAHAARNGTLVNALLAHLQGALPGDALRPGLVHRLDRDTSGCWSSPKTKCRFRRWERR